MYELIYAEGLRFNAQHRFPRIVPAVNRQAGYVSGCCMRIKRSAFCVLPAIIA